MWSYAVLATPGPQTHCLLYFFQRETVPCFATFYVWPWWSNQMTGTYLQGRISPRLSSNFFFDMNADARSVCSSDPSLLQFCKGQHAENGYCRVFAADWSRPLDHFRMSNSTVSRFLKGVQCTWLSTRGKYSRAQSYRASIAPATLMPFVLQQTL